MFLLIYAQTPTAVCVWPIWCAVTSRAFHVRQKRITCLAIERPFQNPRRCRKQYARYASTNHDGLVGSLHTSGLEITFEDLCKIYARLLENQVYQSCRARCWDIQAPSQREDNTPAQTMSHVTGRRAVANWQSSSKFGVEIRLFLQNGKFKANCANPRPPGLHGACCRGIEWPHGGPGGRLRRQGGRVQ
jgi:hypothetical protein